MGVTDVMTGPVLTVKQPAHDPTPPSGFVTVTSRAPTGAVDATEIISVSNVELVNVTDLTVTPEPLTATVAPETKPVPFNFTVRHEAPWPNAFGDNDVAVTAPVALGTTVLEAADAGPVPTAFVAVTVNE